MRRINTFFPFLLLALLPVFVFSASALAQAAEPPVLTTGQRLVAMAPMFILVFLVFYLLVILPQKKQVTMQQALVTSLKKGELVLTSSGMLGRVAGVEQDHVLLEIANGVKVKFERSHIKARVEKKD